MANRDPLLSATQVARLYGTGIITVVELIREGILPTLDDGKLTAAGRLDVPLIRESWARALQRPSGGGSRVLDPPDGELLHPAMVIASNFLGALQDGDTSTVYRLTSSKSRNGLTAADTMSAWLHLIGGRPEKAAGVGSAIYSLAPFPAVAARILAHTPKFPRAVDRPTPARMIAAVPLVEENGRWTLDLQLMKEMEQWRPLLQMPLPSDPEDGG
jgi:hypothetical protein